MRQSVLSGIVIAACVCIAITIAGPLSGSDKTKEKLRYSVQQVERADSAAIYITDSNSTETITIMSGKESGAFIAFYDSKQKSGYPRLAITANGFQIAGPDGRIRHVGVDNLLKLTPHNNGVSAKPHAE